MIPVWLEKTLSDKDVSSIEEAIKTSESVSDAEIIPLIVKKSISSEVNNKLSLISVGLILISLYVLTLGTPLAVVATIVSLGLMVMTVKAKKEIMKNSVESRAVSEFSQLNLHNTSQGTGVLVMVSLYEQKIIILCDTKVSAKIKDVNWEDVSNEFSKNMILKGLGPSLSRAVAHCGEKLKDIIPNRDKENEIPDSLIIKE